MLAHERIRGALLGLACGDALGAPAEFMPRAEVVSRWGTLTDMVGGGPFRWQPGEWTDDTAMALCVAEGIAEVPADPIEPIGRRFFEWATYAPDVGATVRAAIAGASRNGGDWFAAARATPQAARRRAAGNGSVMRCVAVPLAYPDRGTMLRQSARISAMTHWDRQAEAACAVHALWVAALCAGREIRDAWFAAVREARDAIAGGSPVLDGDAPPVPDAFWSDLERAPSLADSDVHATGYALHSLQAAAWAVLTSPSLEQTLVRAANLGDDADTVAAIAGGVAGAWWGPESIPPRWIDRLHGRDRLERAARDLAGIRK